MIKRIFRTLLRALARKLALCRLPADLVAGDLCAIQAGEAGFAVLKVLAVDPEGVHVRLYKQRFRSLPTTPDPAELSLGVFKVDGDTSDAFSIGHLPLTREALAVSWPVRIAHRPVLTGELDGYEMWIESHGGYFDQPIL